MYVPREDIEERYGFDCWAGAEFSDSIKKVEERVPYTPGNIIKGIIRAIDKACKVIGVDDYEKVRCEYGDLTLIPRVRMTPTVHLKNHYKGLFASMKPYHFKGKTWSKIKEELEELCKSFEISPPDELAIDLEDPHLTAFELVSDPLQTLADLPKDWSEEQRKVEIDSMKYHGDLGAGGLKLSHISLEKKVLPGGLKKVIVSAKISTAVAYKGRSSE